MLTALELVDAQKILLCRVSVFSIGLMILRIKMFGVLGEMVSKTLMKGRLIVFRIGMKLQLFKKSRTVLFKPALGILDQDKLVPLRYAPLQFEFELVSNSADCAYVGPIKNDNCTDSWGDFRHPMQNGFANARSIPSMNMLLIFLPENHSL